ncbi:MAG: glycine zipper domain-containing protein [Deltaproteobacteria bacterium]|nr:glycine zipper domain-containing protein [Deltaproteobacteria bacterium]
MLNRVKTRLPALLLSFALAAPLAACESNDGVGVMGRPGWGKTETGALIGGAAGAATGAVIGHQSDNKGKGALIGGATGAVLGGVVGREMEKNDVEKEQQQQQQQYQQQYGY